MADQQALVTTYRARRRIKLTGTDWREPGELVPEAHQWFRTESWLHTGWLEQVEIDEAAFRAAVSQWCPSDSAAILSLVGLDGTRLTGTRSTPAAGSAEPAAAPHTRARHTGPDKRTAAPLRRSPAPLRRTGSFYPARDTPEPTPREATTAEKVIAARAAGMGTEAKPAPKPAPKAAQQTARPD